MTALVLVAFCATIGALLGVPLWGLAIGLGIVLAAHLDYYAKAGKRRGR